MSKYVSIMKTLNRTGVIIYCEMILVNTYIQIFFPVDSIVQVCLYICLIFLSENLQIVVFINIAFFR